MSTLQASRGSDLCNLDTHEYQIIFYIVSGSRFNISKNTITVNTDIEKLIKAEVFKK